MSMEGFGAMEGRGGSASRRGEEWYERHCGRRGSWARIRQERQV